MKSITKIKRPQDIYLTNEGLQERKLFNMKGERITDLSQVKEGKKYQYIGDIAMAFEDIPPFDALAKTKVKALEVDIPSEPITDDSIFRFETIIGEDIEFDVDDEIHDKIKNKTGSMMFL